MKTQTLNIEFIVAYFFQTKSTSKIWNRLHVTIKAPRTIVNHAPMMTLA